MMAGRVTQCTGKYDKALEEARIAVKIDPTDEHAYVALAEVNTYEGKLAEAEDTLRRAAERNLKHADFLIDRYHLAFLKADSAEMIRQSALAPGVQGAEAPMAHEEALVLASSGRLEMARTKWLHAIELARQKQDGEASAMYQMGAGLTEAHLGNAAAALERTKAALAESRARDVLYTAACTMAIAGKPNDAQTLADELAKSYPEDTNAQYYELPVLRALIALDNHQPQTALQALEAARPYDLAQAGPAFVYHYGGLYPIYVRGLAYLAGSRTSEAAQEFHKILDRRGIVLADPIAVLVRVQIARASKSKAAYEDFFRLWKNADPSLPILNQARLEYSKL